MLSELELNPHLLDKHTLYDLRELVARYPYYQPARLLMLKNLYLLHDSSFDEELHRAAIYITDREKLFNLVEAKNYQIADEREERVRSAENTSRTETLIDSFLSEIQPEDLPGGRRKSIPWYATNDYVQLLCQIEDGEIPEEQGKPETESRQDAIINDFFRQGGKIVLPDITDEEEKAINDAILLKDNHDILPAEDKPKKKGKQLEEALLMEKKAHEYIKQGKYSQAKDIISQLNLEGSVK
ncbi:MAG: tetratricopeptide repeat protein, partial [Bacteroidaceae bacterium]|nr:tetratricopeptide repeat protein [Bacteroidaceae bacterium]